MFGMPDLFFGFLGLFVGSFLNVCIYRLPKKESLALPPSHCPECGTRLKPEDLFPVLSYIALKGRCRQCLVPISIRYPLVELTTAALFYMSASQVPNQLEKLDHLVPGEVLFFKNIILLGALLVIFFIDLDHQIIPDSISLPLIPIGLGFALYLGMDVFYDSLKGAAFGFAGYYAIAVLGQMMFRKEAMGGGDIKLAAGIGAFLGTEPMVVGLYFLSFLIGAAVGVPIALFGGKGRREPIPFGPMMAAGAAAALFYTDGLIAWWYARIEKLWS